MTTTLAPAAARAAAESARGSRWSTEAQRTDAACKAARAHTGGRLSAAQKQEIAGIVARILQREANPPATTEQVQPFPGTLAARLDARVKAAVKAAAKSCGYRRSESGWVGGEHRTTVSVGAYVSASGTSEKVWHAKKAWSGTNSSHTFTVKRDWLSRVERAGLAVLDGLLTLDAERVDDGLWKAVWVEQSTGFALRSERGYIALNRAGHLQHAPSEAAARRLQAPAIPAPTPRATAKAQKAEAKARAEALGHRLIPWVVSYGDGPADDYVVSTCRRCLVGVIATDHAIRMAPGVLPPTHDAGVYGLAVEQPCTPYKGQGRQIFDLIHNP
jgi:hypothetical protein